uniref:C2H2-type domain-containing protein n=1 Tax=Trichogramma kaykai TaxID=54128 RepID=A0ABD2XG68_9HYME
MHRLTRRSEPVHLQVEEKESIRSRRSLQNLSSNSVDDKKKCLKCGQFYAQMIEHEKICISNLNIYQCPFCTYKCHSKLDMKDHITNNNHLLDEVTKEDSNESNINAEIICTACKDIRNDLNTTYRSKCKLCNASMTYRCIKCKTEFNSKREFSKHVRLEHTMKS